MTVTPQTPVINQGGMVANPQNLAELKAQLRQSLAQVEAQEQVMAESMKPQTVEEVDMLEQKLTEALHELRHHKEELRRRTSER
jgi:16S rRNA G1207 methylase RsmC